MIRKMDGIDRKILSLLVEDGRRTYDDIAARVSRSAPSVKRRIDRLRASGALEGFTAVVDHGAMGHDRSSMGTAGSSGTTGATGSSGSAGTANPHGHMGRSHQGAMIQMAIQATNIKHVSANCDASGNDR